MIQQGSGIFWEDDPSEQLNKMIQDIDKMGEKEDAAVRKALQSGANVVLAAQKALVPRRTGKLARALKISEVYVNPSSKRYVCRVGYNFKENPEAKHGIYLEFGRKGNPEAVNTKGKNKGENKGKMKAQPHVRPGFDASKDRAAEITLQTFIKELGL